MEGVLSGTSGSVYLIAFGLPATESKAHHEVSDRVHGERSQRARSNADTISVTLSTI